MRPFPFFSDYFNLLHLLFSAYLKSNDVHEYIEENLLNKEI